MTYRERLIIRLEMAVPGAHFSQCTTDHLERCYEKLFDRSPEFILRELIFEEKKCAQ